MEKETFEISDFYTAAFLLSRDFKIITLNRNNPRRVFFAFSDQEGREKLIEDFFNYKTRVEPRKFIASIKELKNLLYSDALEKN